MPFNRKNEEQPKEINLTPPPEMSRTEPVPKGENVIVEPQPGPIPDSPPVEFEPMPTGESKLSIRECAACGGQHADLEIHEYKHRTPVGTHWFICPTTGDPVGLTLVMMDGQNGLEVHERIVLSLIEAQKSDSYLSAIFRIDEGLVKLTRTTHNFPTGDFSKCLGLLKDDLERELQNAPTPLEAMQEAKPIAPKVNLFGGDTDAGGGAK